MSGFDDYLSAPAATGSSGFDSYLGAPQAAPTAPTSTTPQPGILASFVNGLGHGVGNGAIGIEQLLGHAVNGFGYFPNAAGNYMVNDAAQARQQNDASYVPYSKAHPFIAGMGNVAGEIGITAPTMLMGPEYTGLSLGGKIGLGATQGAAGAAMMPVDNQNDGFLAQKGKQMALGAALGGAFPLVGAAASSVGRNVSGLVRPVFQPGKFVGSGLAGSLSPADAQAVAANIRGAQSFVPGSMPTTAQVGAMPVLVQTEKALANASPDFKTALAQRGIDNNQARWNALMGVAQSPEALAAAEQARTDLASPLYDATHVQTANVGPAFMRYAQIPEMQHAMQEGNSLASLDAAVGRGVTPVWPTPPTATDPGSRAINGAALDYTSRALDGMINKAQRDGATSRAGALTALKGKIDDWTQAYIPGVQDARQTYAGASVPINTMEAGQQIANTLGTRGMNASGIPQIELSGYRAALGQALKNQPYGIDPDALGVLQGIGQDLQRATVSNSIRSPGSDTAYNLGANGWLARNLYGNNFGGASGLGRGLVGFGTALGSALGGHPLAGLGVGAGVVSGMGKMGQLVGQRLQKNLGNLLLDPQALLPYLDSRAASVAQPIGQTLGSRLLQYGRPSLVGVSTQLLNQSGN